jgi:hypothetical protein
MAATFMESGKRRRNTSASTSKRSTRIPTLSPPSPSLVRASHWQGQFAVADGEGFAVDSQHRHPSSIFFRRSPIAPT